MSTTSYGEPDLEIILGETEFYTCDFGSTVTEGGALNAGELLSSVTSILQESVDPATIGGVATTAITLANKSVGTGTPTINGRVVASGEYVQFTGALAAGANAVDASYTVVITAVTNAAIPRTLVRRVIINVLP